MNFSAECSQYIGLTLVANFRDWNKADITFFDKREIVFYKKNNLEMKIYHGSCVKVTD